MADEYVNPVTMKAGAGFMELTSGDTDGIPGDEVIKISNLADTGQDILSFKIYKPYSLAISPSSRSTLP